ncbi:MAG: hypothetical protein OIF34_12130, partial [Porticoccaceae bacterium]|nr:hypothetical protein [Porticoccaceae bacterium]
PQSAWNYGLVFDDANPALSFSVEKGAWPKDNFPFTLDSVPLTVRVKAKRIPEWVIDGHGLAGALQNSPVKSSEPEETVELVPMGAARLRISTFPVIGEGDDAINWNTGYVPL